MRRALLLTIGVALPLTARCRPRSATPDATPGATPDRRVAPAVGSPDLQKMLDSVIRNDTGPAPYTAAKELNLMTAPIDVMPLRTYESDTLEWLMKGDSCRMLVRSHGPTGAMLGFGGDWASLGSGITEGPGGAVDVSPSPNWKYLAYTGVTRLPPDTAGWGRALKDLSLTRD